MTQIIAAAGVLGVGKTTLVQHLAPRLDAVPCYETVAAADFLRQFYEDPATHALQTETVYLLGRYTALKKVLAAAPDRVICDFVPFKGLVYSDITLSGSEQEAFVTIYEAVEPLIPQPDMVLNLIASRKTVLDRIAIRARPGEPERVTAGYLAQLRAAYDRELQRRDLPTLDIDTDAFSLLSDRDLEALVRRVEKVLAA